MAEDRKLPIMDILWTVIERADVKASHIFVNWQEFYLFNYMENLLFTPEEVAAAHQRFIQSKRMSFSTLKACHSRRSGNY